MTLRATNYAVSFTVIEKNTKEILKSSSVLITSDQRKQEGLNNTWSEQSFQEVIRRWQEAVYRKDVAVNILTVQAVQHELDGDVALGVNADLQEYDDSDYDFDTTSFLKRCLGALKMDPPQLSYDDLRALVLNGPLSDGDVPSKSGRNRLIKEGLASDAVIGGKDGYTVATYLGRALYKMYLADRAREQGADKMDELTCRREEKFKAEAHAKLQEIMKMPPVLCTVIYDFFKHVREYLNDGGKNLSRINPIDLVDIHHVEPTAWVFSAEEVRYFRIALNEPKNELFKIVRIHSAPATRSKDQDKKYANFLIDIFKSWKKDCQECFGSEDQHAAAILFLGIYFIGYYAGMNYGVATHYDAADEQKNFTVMFYPPDGSKIPEVTITFYSDGWKK